LFRASRRISGGESRKRLRKLGVVEEFIEGNDLSGGNLAFRLFAKMIEFPAGRVRFDLPIPSRGIQY
jgi:hypothetical protein